MGNNTTISRAQLLEVLHYDQETGIFSWAKSIATKVKTGSIAGHISADQYQRIVIFGRKYLAHRLAWLYVHGEWPDGQIDHINRQKNDNRLANLRCVSCLKNQHNKGAYANNKSGTPGVHWHTRDQRWRAVIGVNGRRVRLGSYIDRSAAEAAYQQAKAVYHA
ncbi:HNH endonuclease [Corticibacter populi]|nr:HNH endonuclease [Corticibacter populi]RZS35844.1 AP2 domain-containing protein [Corticibacter populi]